MDRRNAQDAQFHTVETWSQIDDDPNMAVLGVGEVREYASERAKMVVTRLRHGLVELRWFGTFDDDALPVIGAYLNDFLQASEQGPLHMLHDLSELQRYTKSALTSHARFSLDYGDRIGRIAVVSRRAMVFLGVATVASWQHRPIKNFSNRESALTWIGEDERPLQPDRLQSVVRT